MSDRVIIHDRVGVKGQEVPVDENSFSAIPEELHDQLDMLQRYVQELENARNELGRLTQVIHHLVYVCNTAERNAANAKKQIIESMDLGDGNWAIDFEAKQIGKVDDKAPAKPRVV